MDTIQNEGGVKNYADRIRSASVVVGRCISSVKNAVTAALSKVFASKIPSSSIGNSQVAASGAMPEAPGIPNLIAELTKKSMNLTPRINFLSKFALFLKKKMPMLKFQGLALIKLKTNLNS
jgi:hypothetical protein